MIKLFIKNWFGDDKDEDRQITLDQATALLLYEAATADFELDEREMTSLLAALSEGLNIDTKAAASLADWAKTHSLASTSLQPFTRVLNEAMTPEQKTQLMTQLWQVAYADGHIDKYEEHYLRHIADLLFLPHSLYMKAKLSAKALHD